MNCTGLLQRHYCSPDKNSGNFDKSFLLYFRSKSLDTHRDITHQLYENMDVLQGMSCGGDEKFVL